MPDIDLHLPGTPEEHAERVGRNYALPAHARALDRSIGRVPSFTRVAAEDMTERQLAIEETRLAPTVALTDFHIYARTRELEYRRMAMQAERVWRNPEERKDFRNRMLLDYQFANHRQTQYRATAEMLEEQRSFLQQYLIQIQTLLPMLPEGERRAMMGRQREVASYLYALNAQVERTTRAGSFLHTSNRIRVLLGEGGLIQSAQSNALNLARYQVAGRTADRDRLRTEILEAIQKFPAAEQEAARTALTTLVAAVPSGIPEGERAARIAALQAPGGAIHVFNGALTQIAERLGGTRSPEGQPTSLGSLTRARLDGFLLLSHLHQPRLAQLQRIETRLTARPAPAPAVLREIYFTLRPHAENAPADAQIAAQCLTEVQAQITQQRAIVAAVQNVRSRRANTAASNTPDNQRLQLAAELALSELLSKMMGDGLVRGAPGESRVDVIEADLGEQEHRLGQTLHNMADRPLGTEAGLESRPTLHGKTVAPGMTLYFTHADNAPLTIGAATLAVRPAARTGEGPSVEVAGVEYVRMGGNQLQVRVKAGAADGERTLEYGPDAARIRVTFTVSSTQEADVGIERVPPGVLPQYLLIDAIQARYTQLLGLQTQTLERQRDGALSQTQAAQILRGLSERREEMMRQQLHLMGRLGMYQERMAELFAFQNAFGQGRRTSGLIGGLPYNQLRTARPPEPEPDTDRMHQRRADMARVMEVQRRFHASRIQMMSASIRQTLDDGDRAQRDHRWLNEELPQVRRTANAAALVITSPLALPGMVPVAGPVIGRVTNPMRDALVSSIGDQVHRALETGPDGRPLPAEEQERRRKSLLDLMNGFDRTKLTKVEASAAAVQGINANLLRGARLTEAHIREASTNTSRVPTADDEALLKLLSGPGPGHELTEEQKIRGSILLLKLLKQFKEDVGDMENPNERNGVLGEYAWFLLETERLLNIRLDVRSLLYEMSNKWLGVMRAMIIGAAASPLVLTALAGAGGAAGAGATWAVIRNPRLLYRVPLAVLRSPLTAARWGAGTLHSAARGGFGPRMLGGEYGTGALNNASMGLSTYMAFDAWQRQFEAAQRSERSRVEIENALRALGCTKDEANEKWIYNDRDNDIRADIPFALIDGCLSPFQDESNTLFNEALTMTGLAGGQLAGNIVIARMREAAVRQAMERARAAGVQMTRRMALQSMGRITQFGVRAIPVIGIIINVVLIGISIAAKRRKMRGIRKFMNGLPPALLAEVSWEGITGADLYTFLREHSDQPESDEETPAQRREARERGLFVYFEGTLRDKQPQLLSEIYAGMGNRFELAQFFEREFKPVYLPLYYLTLYRMCQATPAFRHHRWEAISQGETVNGSHHIPREMIERALETAARLFLHLHVYERQYREVAHASAMYQGNDPEVRASLDEMERTLGARRILGGAMNPAMARELAALDVRPGAVERPGGLPDAFVRDIDAAFSAAPALAPTSTPDRLRTAIAAAQKTYAGLEANKREAGFHYIENAAAARGYRAQLRVRDGGVGTILLLPAHTTRMNRIAKLIRERGPSGSVAPNEVPGVGQAIQFIDMNIFATWAAESMENPAERITLRRELAQENMGSARWDSAYAANTLFWDVLNPEPVKRNAFYVGGYSGYAVRMPSRGPLPPELGAAAEWTGQHIFGIDRMDPRSQIVFQTTAGDREAFARSSLSENAAWLFGTRYNGRTIGRSRDMERRFFPEQGMPAPTVLASGVSEATNRNPNLDTIMAQMIRNATTRDPSFSRANLESVAVEGHDYIATKRIMRGMMVVHPLERLSPRHTLRERNFLYRATFVFMVNGERHYVTATSMSFQTPDGICEDDFEDNMGSSVDNWLRNPNRPYRTVYDGAFAFDEATFTESAGSGYARWLQSNLTAHRQQRVTEEVSDEADAFNYSGSLVRRAPELELETGGNGPLVYLGIPAFMGDTMSPGMHTMATQLLRPPPPLNSRLRHDASPTAIAIEFPQSNAAVATYIYPITAETDGPEHEVRCVVRRRAIRMTNDERMEEGSDMTRVLGAGERETQSLLRLFRANERQEAPATPRDVLLRINRERNERNAPLLQPFQASIPEAVATAGNTLAERLRSSQPHAEQLTALNAAIVAGAEATGERPTPRTRLLNAVALRYSHPSLLPQHRLRVADGAITVVQRGSAELLRDGPGGNYALRLDDEGTEERLGIVIPGRTATVSRAVSSGGHASALIVPTADESATGDRIIIRREGRVDIDVSVVELSSFMQRDDLPYDAKRDVLKLLLAPRQGETRRQQIERVVALFAHERRGDQSSATLLVSRVLPLIDAELPLPEGRRRAPDPQLLVRQLTDRLLANRMVTLANIDRLAAPFSFEGGEGRSPMLVFPASSGGSSVELADGRTIDMVRLHDGRFASRLLDESLLQKGSTLTLHAPQQMRFGDTRENLAALPVGQSRTLCGNRFTIRRIDPQTVEFTVAIDAADGTADLFAEIPGQPLITTLRHTGVSVLALSVGTPPAINSDANNALLRGNTTGFYRPGERLFSPLRPGQVRRMTAPRGTSIDGQLMDDVGSEKRIEYAVGTGDNRRTGTAIFRREANDVLTLQIEGAAYGSSSTVISLRFADTPRGRHFPVRINCAPPQDAATYGISSALPTGVQLQGIDGTIGVRIGETTYRVANIPATETLAEGTRNRWHNVREDADDREYVLESGTARAFLRMGQRYTSRAGPFLEYDNANGARFGADILIREVDSAGSVTVLKMYKSLLDARATEGETALQRSIRLRGNELLCSVPAQATREEYGAAVRRIFDLALFRDSSTSAPSTLARRSAFVARITACMLATPENRRGEVLTRLLTLLMEQADNKGVIGSSQLVGIETAMENAFPPPIVEGNGTGVRAELGELPHIVYYRGTHVLLSGLPANCRVRLVNPEDHSDRSFSSVNAPITVAAGASVPLGIAPEGTANRIANMAAEGALLIYNERNQYLGRVIFLRREPGVRSAEDRIREETQQTLRSDASSVRRDMDMAADILKADGDVAHLQSLVAGVLSSPPAQTAEQFRASVVATVGHLQESIAPLSSVWKEHVLRVANGVLAPGNVHITTAEDRLSVADGAIAAETIDGSPATAEGSVRGAYFGMMRTTLQGINTHARSANLTEEQLRATVPGLNLNARGAAALGDGGVVAIEAAEGAQQIVVLTSEGIQQSVREHIAALPQLKPPAAMDVARRLARLYHYAHIASIRLPADQRVASNPYVSVECAEGAADATMQESLQGRAYQTFLRELPSLLETARNGEWQTLDQLFGEDGRLKWLCYEMRPEDRPELLTAINAALPTTTRVRFGYTPGRNVHVRELTTLENRSIDQAVERTDASPERRAELIRLLAAAAAGPSEGIDDLVYLLAAQYEACPADDREAFIEAINSGMRTAGRTVRVRVLNGRLQRAMNVPNAADTELLEERVEVSDEAIAQLITPATMTAGLTALTESLPAAALRPAYIAGIHQRLAAQRSPVRVRISGNTVVRAPDAAVAEQPHSPSTVVAEQLIGAWSLRPTATRPFNVPQEAYNYGRGMHQRLLEGALALAQTEYEAVPAGLRATYVDALNTAMARVALRIVERNGRLERGSADPVVDNVPNARYVHVPDADDVPAGVLRGDPGEANVALRRNIDLHVLGSVVANNRWTRLNATEGSTFYFFGSGISLRSQDADTLYRAIREGDAVRYEKLPHNAAASENFRWTRIDALPRGIAALPANLP